MRVCRDVIIATSMCDRVQELTRSLEEYLMKVDDRQSKSKVAISAAALMR